MIGNTNTETYNNITYNKFYTDQSFYKIKVIDYDGTVIDHQDLAVNQEYTLPTPPTHDGLIFQEWSCSQSITDNKVVVGDNNITIGAVYTTVSGKNEFDIELTKASGLTFLLNLGNTKDWGDGTSDTATSHTYANYGKYTIKCDGGMYSLSSGSGLFGQNNSNWNTTVKNIRLATTSVANYAFQYCVSLRTITLSRNSGSLDTAALQYCYKLSAVVLPSNASYITSSVFRDCTSLTSLVIPNNFTSIPNSFCDLCTSLASFVIPNNITNIGQNAFQSCTSLKSLIIPNSVKKIYGNCFHGCYSLKNLKFTNTNFDISGTSAFSNCTFNEIKFNSVANIPDSTFYSCTALKKIDLSSVSAIPTLSGTYVLNQINGICKIIVPFNLYSTWREATNWVLYKDYIYSAESATINFVGDTTNVDIYVDDELINGTSLSWGGTSLTYYCYDAVNNALLPTQTETGIVADTTHNITIDLSTKKRIMLSTGVSGLSVKFTIEGKDYNATASSGNYYIDIVGSGVTVDYYIDGGDNYMDESGTITTTGSDITTNITMTPAYQMSWVRPNLTSNGTLGTDNFAVAANQYSSSYAAYKAVDDGSSSYWYGYPSGNIDYTFYVSDKIKVSELTFNFVGGYQASSVIVQGSDNNIDYENITTSYSGDSSTAIYTATLTNNKYYHYYKITFINSYYTRIYNLQINAVYKSSSGSDPIK